MPRDELIISTKAGFRMWPGPYGEWLSKKYLVASLDQSLSRLGLEYVDIYYAHRPDPETPLEETMAALDLIVRQGKALYIGISNFSGAETAAAARVAVEMGLAPITIHQPAYNLIGRRCEWDLFDHTERIGCGVVAFLPLAQGVLTDKYLSGEIPPDSRAAQRWSERHRKIALSAETLDRVRRLREIAASRGQSLPQMAIAWVLRHPSVTTALIGASRVEHIEENVGALGNLDFSDEELRAIDEISPPR
jgi:L-glyceraldehyde 3-phosphate reductase